MKGKHELRTHIPNETYKYLKTHATRHGIGTLIASAVDLYARQGDLAKRIIAIEDHLGRLADHFEAGEKTHAVCAK
jgi:hypothetical protein